MEEYALMISLKRTLDDLEELNLKFRTALRCYLSAIESVGASAVEVERDLAAGLRQQLRSIHRAASQFESAGALDGTRLEFEARLREYASLSRTVLRCREQDVREILAAVAEAASAVAERADRHAGHFRAVARELESVAEVDSLSLIRERLTGALARLKACTEQMWHQSHDAATQMEDQLRRFQRRVEEAEALALTDPLTGLANRRRAESVIGSRIAEGAPLCLLLLDLDHFKTINDRLGHATGDQVLRSFAERLTAQFPQEDVVCRWGGDEFLVIVTTALADPLARARQVGAKMRGLYAIQSPSGPLNVELAASVGVAQHRPGEDGDRLFARADAALYQEKRGRSGRAPGLLHVQPGAAC